MRLVAVVLLVGCGRVGFDATTTSDAIPTDATRDSAGSFCAQHATADLCTDFDDGTTTNWNLGGTTNGNYVVDNGALLSTIDPLATNTDVAEAYLNHPFGVMGSHIVLALDVRIEQIGQGDAVFGQVRFAGALRHGVEYVYRAAGSYVEEFRDTTFEPPYNVAGPSLTVGEWHRIELDMDLRTTPHVTARHDGVVVVDADLAGNDAGTMRASVGLVFLRGPSTTWVLRTDNVVVDIE